MKKRCKHCRASFRTTSNINICHSCKLTEPCNGIKIYQTPSTNHITKDEKRKVADFIIKNHGTLFKIYKESIPYIKEELGINLDFKGVRSIVNSSYYKEAAFD
jgi:hypothetical protein